MEEKKKPLQTSFTRGIERVGTLLIFGLSGLGFVLFCTTDPFIGAGRDERCEKGGQRKLDKKSETQTANLVDPSQLPEWQTAG